MSTYKIVIEIEIENADTPNEAAAMVAYQLMNEETNFTLFDCDGCPVGDYNTSDFA